MLISTSLGSTEYTVSLSERTAHSVLMFDDQHTHTHSLAHTHSLSLSHTHLEKAKPLAALAGHAFLVKPGHLCTKQVRCAGAMQTPGARARSSQEY